MDHEVVNRIINQYLREMEDFDRREASNPVYARRPDGQAQPTPYQTPSPAEKLWIATSLARRDVGSSLIEKHAALRR